jgi:hypothetical protein
METMKRLNNILGGINWLLVMAVISNYIFLLIMKDFLPEVQPPDWMAGLVAITILVMGMINLINLFGITKQFQYFKQANFLSSGSFVLGFFSLFMLVVSVVMLQDIGQEARVGFESTGEWNMVFFGQSLQGIFGLFMLALQHQSAKLLEMNIEIPVIEKDEAIFLTVHQVGIFSAFVGFVCMFTLKIMAVPAGYLNGLYIIAAIVAIIPYGFAALYWFIPKRKEKISEWYDEKQYMDIARGALITLVVTVILMTLFFILMLFKAVPDGMMLWFPVYLCATLLVFSLSNQVIANG